MTQDRDSLVDLQCAFPFEHSFGDAGVFVDHGMRKKQPPKLPLREAPKTRASVARRQKRLMLSIQSLHEHGLIPMKEYRVHKKKIETMILTWKEQIRIARGPRKRGRPRIERPDPATIKCRKIGCANPEKPGMGYCCRDHAPLSNYGVDTRSWR